MPDEIRDSLGRFLRDPRDGERAFDDWKGKPRDRDRRSGRTQSVAAFQLSCRLPLRVMAALRAEALRRDCSVTKIILSAIEKELQPAMHDQKHLVDRTAAPIEMAVPQKLPRLANELPSPVNPKTPSFDHVGTWRAKKERQRNIGGHLVDKR